MPTGSDSSMVLREKWTEQWMNRQLKQNPQSTENQFQVGFGKSHPIPSSGMNQQRNTSHGLRERVCPDLLHIFYPEKLLLSITDKRTHMEWLWDIKQETHFSKNVFWKLAALGDLVTFLQAQHLLNKPSPFLAGISLPGNDLGLNE